MGAPERAVRLLTCETQEEAEPLSAEICEDNNHRREVEAQIAKEAMEKIEQDPALLYSRVIVVDGEGWHHGVIGIVASRITERFGKPCMVISLSLIHIWWSVTTTSIPSWAARSTSFTEAIPLSTVMIRVTPSW